MDTAGSDRQPLAWMKFNKNGDEEVCLNTYGIKNPKGDRQLVIFQPFKQVLIFPGETPVIRVDMGFASSRLLELLIRRADSVVEREEILAYAWPNRVVTQNSLNQAVRSIREWLGDDIGKDIIKTVPRRGYQFSSASLSNSTELPMINHSEQSASIPESKLSSLIGTALARHFSAPANTLLFWAVLALGSSLLMRIDWGLIWQPGLVISQQEVDNHRFTYTAPDENSLEALQVELAPLRKQLLGLTDMPGTFLLNSRHKFYEVICINKNAETKLLTIHLSQLAQVTDEQLRECFK